jgi:hypothetical protein
MTTLARHVFLVGSTVLATLAVRALVAPEPAAPPVGAAAPAPALRVDHGRALDELRHEVARLRESSGAVTASPTPPASMVVVDPQVRRDAWTRASDMISAAESRGTWTSTDMAAMGAELRFLPDEDRRELLTRVHTAVADGRLDPRPRVNPPPGGTP